MAMGAGRTGGCDIYTGELSELELATLGDIFAEGALHVVSISASISRIITCAWVAYLAISSLTQLTIGAWTIQFSA